MSSLARRRPSTRFILRHLIRDQSVDASALIAAEFFEAQAPAAPAPAGRSVGFASKLLTPLFLRPRS
jgi:hypothetical protein